MQFNAYHYIQLYQNLQIPQTTKEANHLLLQLEASQSSWAIAIDLIKIQEYYLHGFQLLSKKLNQNISKSISLKELLDFILKYPKKNDLIFCCAAKVMIHLNIYTLPKEYTDSITLLRILKEYPLATSLVQISYDKKSQRNIFFQNSIPILIQNFNRDRDLIIDCIDSHVMTHGKVNSNQIVKLLLGQPLSVVGHLLEEIFLNQNCGEIAAEIWSYLIQQQNSNQSQYFPVYIAFCRSLSYNKIQSHLLTEIIKKILIPMKSDSLNIDSNHQSIADTFQFWFKLSTDLKNKVLNQANIVILLEAIIQVWKIILDASKAKQIPQKSKPIIINLEDYDDTNNKIISNIEIKFRSTAQDFILLCLDTIDSYQEYKKRAYQIVHNYASSNQPLNLQLSIFIMTNITQLPMQFSQTCQLYHAEILKTLLRQEQYLTNYLCQKLINFMGKLEHVLKHNLEVLCLVLNFMRKALSYQELAQIAAKNFTQILVGFEPKSSNQHTAQENQLQRFLNQIYDKLYGQIRSQSILQHLTNALLTFIFKFRRYSQSYQAFLTTFNMKIQQQPTQKSKVKYLQCLLNSSQWAMTSNLNEEYLSLLNKLILSYMQILLNNCDQAQRKHELTLSVQTINLAIKLLGHYQSQRWIYWISQLIERMLNCKQSIYGVLMAPFLTFIDLQQIRITKNQQILEFINAYQEKLTKYLLTKEQIDYNLTKYLIQIHKKIIKNYIWDHDRRVFFQHYNPNTIIQYITQKIIRNNSFTEYQILRQSLYVYILLINQSYQLPFILENVLRSYKKIADMLWKQVESILLEIYKKSGINIFINIFQMIKPQLLPPNPLWEEFEKALINSQARIIKNILLCLT